MRTKAKTRSVSYWINCIIGQTKQLPRCPEDEANYEIGLALVKGEGWDPEKKKVA